MGETTNDRSLDLLCVPELRRIFLILTFNILANVIAYNGLGLNSLNFHKSALVNFALLCLTDLPAITLGRYLVDSYPGRRWTNAGGLFVCGVVLCATVLIPSSATTALMAISIVGKFGTAVSYMVIYQQAAELYPTTLRTQGLTINATFGSFSNLCIPFITYLVRVKLSLSLSKALTFAAINQGGPDLHFYKSIFHRIIDLLAF